MTAIAIALAVALGCIALLHVYWGLGGVWPGADAQDCARRVVGVRGVRSMPGTAPSFAVALLLAAAALIALGAAGGHPLAVFFALAAGLVFLGRGMAGFTPAWRRLTPELPFARYDVRYYSPLCLAIAAGFLALTWNGLAA
ncbi:MAG: DUF3995 domain-containing protein [Rhizobiaceae bacterium]|nr:DUF3995 domain-containing protein [Rhizobiaceae bacterium]